MKAAMLLVMDMLNDLVHDDGGGAKTYVPLTKSAQRCLARFAA